MRSGRLLTVRAVCRKLNSFRHLRHYNTQYHLLVTYSMRMHRTPSIMATATLLVFMLQTMMQRHHLMWKLTNNSRVRMKLVLGYWVLGNIHRYWSSIGIGGYFLLFWHPIQHQSDSSQRHPHASEWLFSSACDLYSDSCSCLSAHHADMLLFIKYNHCRHHRVLGLFMVIAMLFTSICIGIG